MELFTPELGLVFWMFVTFVILFAILAKFAWPAIVKMLEERADLIDKGVVYAQNAKEQLDNAKSEAASYIAEARKQQAEILREADKMKTQIIEEAKAAATVEAKKVMEAANLASSKGIGKAAAPRGERICPRHSREGGERKPCQRECADQTGGQTIE